MSASPPPIAASRHVRLGVNIDHVATLRQARLTPYPSPTEAAVMALEAGADLITVHLREDRRHIQEYDLDSLRRAGVRPINLELAATTGMAKLAAAFRPERCCLVPERREELTTEGGLDVAGNSATLDAVCTCLGEAGVHVALFIDPDSHQVDAAAALGVPAIELHTGRYADAGDDSAREAELGRLAAAARTRVGGRPGDPRRPRPVLPQHRRRGRYLRH